MTARGALASLTWYFSAPFLSGTLLPTQLNYLLHLPSTPPEKRADVAGRLRDVIVDLAVSLGLERSTILQQVCSALQLGWLYMNVLGLALPLFSNRRDESVRLCFVLLREKKQIMAMLCTVLISVLR